jgi:hypothetical protein
MHPICTSMLAKFYSCKKWVLHENTPSRSNTDHPSWFVQSAFNESRRRVSPVNGPRSMVAWTDSTDLLKGK